MSAPVYSANCEVCGEEHLSLELIPMRLGNKSTEHVRSCLACLSYKVDAEDDYRDAAQMIIEALRKEILPFT